MKQTIYQLASHICQPPVLPTYKQQLSHQGAGCLWLAVSGWKQTRAPIQYKDVILPV